MTITIDTSNLKIPSMSTMNKAISSALNKTVVTAKKEMSQAVRAKYNVKKKDLDSKMKVTKSTVNNTQSVISIRSRPIGLIHFGATAAKAFDKGQKRYFKTSAKVLRNERKKVVNGAFIGRAKNSSSWQVFRRTGDKRLPIVKMSVISPTSMIAKEGADDFEKVIVRDFKKNFDHELEFYLGKQK